MLAWFRLLPLVAQIVGPLVIVGLAGGAYWGWHHHVEQSGYDRAIRAIAAQDKEAVNAADNARMPILSCRASGGVWRASSGECERR